MSDTTDMIGDDLGPRAQRRSGFARNEDLMEALQVLNTRLARVQTTEIGHTTLPYRPVFIVGCPRSGTTLLCQALAATGRFSYPTNIVSRFYANPWVGAMVHRILYDLDDRHEIFPGSARGPGSMESELGKTSGAKEPNEFWYWWRRFFRFKGTHAEMEALDESDIQRFRTDLMDLMQVFQRPFMAKAMIMNWHIPLLSRIVPEALFLFLERDLQQNALSLLACREKFYGDRSIWYAFKPAEYASIIDLDPVEQVFAQVRTTNTAIRQGIGQLPAGRSMHWRYTEFCNSPAEHINALLQAIGEPPLERSPGTFNGRAPHIPSDIPMARLKELQERYAD